MRRKMLNVRSFQIGTMYLFSVCKAINSQDGVTAVFGASTSISTPLAESICKHFSIPYIITSWRESFNQRSNTVLNFHPDADLFSTALANIVKSLDWQGFYIIYESEEGLMRLQEVLKLQVMGEKNPQEVITVKQLEPGGDQRCVKSRYFIVIKQNL